MTWKVSSSSSYLKSSKIQYLFWIPLIQLSATATDTLHSQVRSMFTHGSALNPERSAWPQFKPRLPHLLNSVFIGYERYVTIGNMRKLKRWKAIGLEVRQSLYIRMSYASRGKPRPVTACETCGQISSSERFKWMKPWQGRKVVGSGRRNTKCVI